MALIFNMQRHNHSIFKKQPFPGRELPPTHSAGSQDRRQVSTNDKKYTAIYHCECGTTGNQRQRPIAGLPFIKRLLFALAVLFLCTVSLQAQKVRPEDEIRKSPQDVLDYYLILPDELFQNTPYESRSDFYSRITLLADSREKMTTLDQKNNFLQIIDAYGHPEYRVTVKVLDLPGVERLICTSFIFRDDSCSTFQFEIYRYKYGKWIHMTDKVIPGLTLQDYWNELRQPLPDELNSIQVEAELPRIGSTIRLYARIRCEEYFPDDDDLYELYLMHFTQREYRAIYFDWNKQLQRFTESRKIKR